MPADAIERLLEALVKPAYMGVIGGDQSAMDEARALLAEFQAEVLEDVVDSAVATIRDLKLAYHRDIFTDEDSPEGKAARGARMVLGAAMRRVADLRTKAKEARDG